MRFPLFSNYVPMLILIGLILVPGEYMYSVLSLDLVIWRGRGVEEKLLTARYLTSFPSSWLLRTLREISASFLFPACPVLISSAV